MPTRFLNYPTPKAHTVSFEAPPPGRNPVFKGWPLHLLSYAVAAIPLVPYALWSNAGFSSLRKCRKLDVIDARHDPTVIPLPSEGDEFPENYTDIANCRVPVTSETPFYTVRDFYDKYSSGALTPTDVIEALLPLILRDEDSKKRTPATAFLETKVELVKQAAAASTQRWKRGQPLGILDGVPFGVKDDVAVKGYKRYYGTKHDYTDGGETETSWCVKKLEEAGAILVGKLVMHELGTDTTNNNPIWGTPLNPYNTAYYTGGSSGGPASAVGYGLLAFSIGSDGGGSIRIPSCYCGLYGLKPSHARVSLAPIPEPGSSVTVHGPLASNMTDLEVSYRVLAQPDPAHFPSSQFSPPKRLSGPRNKVLGVYKAWLDRADPIVQEACQSALSFFKSELGYEVIDISIPLLHQGQIAHAMTILAEGASGHQTSIYDLTGPNRVLMSVARQTPATDFVLAQRVRKIIMEHLAQLFRSHPGLVIVTPTTPNAGWAIGNGELGLGFTDANKQIRNMEYVWLANFTGIPCIQFPVAYVNGSKGSGKVPLGLSGHGEWGSEDALIEFGFDGERYLHEGYEGGKVRPDGWIDILNPK